MGLFEKRQKNRLVLSFDAAEPEDFDEEPNTEDEYVEEMR
jgi:hypothetical protein